MSEQIDTSFKKGRGRAQKSIDLIEAMVAIAESAQPITGRRVGYKRKDPRYKWFIENFGNQCWEIDALDPNILRNRVEEEIKSLIEPKAWKRCEVVNRAESNSLRHVLAAWAKGRAL